MTISINRFSHWKVGRLGLVAAMLVLCGAGGAAAQRSLSLVAKSISAGRICQAQNGKPTSRCVTAHDVNLRGKDLTARIAARDLSRLRGFAGSTAPTHEGVICIVDGGWICPPEPYDIVWVCITTSQLAGSTCPEKPENAPPDASLTVKFHGR